MIHYQEKGIGLHIAIAEAGLSLVQIDGEWVADDDVAVQAIIDNYDQLQGIRDSAILQIYDAVKKKLDTQAEGYSAPEVATWPFLQSEVLQYNANSTIGPMMQSVIARGRLTADSLSALLTPKINFQNALLTKRDNGVERISAINDWTLIAAELAAILAEIEAI